MKKKEKASLQSMKSQELEKVITEARQKLAQYNINRYSKQSKNTHEGTAIRRKIAVASTFKHIKELSNE